MINLDHLHGTCNGPHKNQCTKYVPNFYTHRLSDDILAIHTEMMENLFIFIETDYEERVVIKASPRSSVWIPRKCVEEKKDIL